MDASEDTARSNEASSREDNEIRDDTDATIVSRPVRGIVWETYVRCFFLLAVVSLLGFLSWQPAILRLNILYSFASPSHGEGLAWKADAVPADPVPEARRTRPPEEWRLTSAFSADWLAQRPPAKNASVRSEGLSRVAWRRYSANPWSWRDDVARSRRRVEDLDAMQPAQKPASSFRAGNVAAFPESDPMPARATPIFPGLAADGAGLSAPPALPPLGREGEGPPFSLPTPSGDVAQGFNDLQPPPLPAVGGDAGPSRTLAAAPAVQAPPPSGAVSAVQPSATNPPTRAQTFAPSPSPQEVDWKNHEITGPIPDAYLTIYPKLKFIGLCVPGQGYIRKYNQVGVPADVNGPKMFAQDGRTPYGRYYIADRNRDADGARLYLSWPSPDDADRIGLPPTVKSAVEAAWRRQGLPPQNTPAGGGIAINGLRQWVETTEGGFTLEEPHMEEIFTALPDKAWVFVQP